MMDQTVAQTLSDACTMTAYGQRFYILSAATAAAQNLSLNLESDTIDAQLRAVGRSGGGGGGGSGSDGGCDDDRR